MKHAIVRSSMAAAAFVSSVGVVSKMAHAQQVPNSETASQVPGPPPGTAMTKAYVQTVGRMAYVYTSQSS